MIPVGSSTVIISVSGPRSDRAKRMPNPAMPSIEKEPWTPA